MTKVAAAVMAWQQHCHATLLWQCKVEVAAKKQSTGGNRGGKGGSGGGGMVEHCHTTSPWQCKREVTTKQEKVNNQLMDHLNNYIFNKVLCAY